MECHFYDLDKGKILGKFGKVPEETAQRSAKLMLDAT